MTISASIANTLAVPGSTGGPLTSSAIDTTGANFIIVSACGDPTALANSSLLSDSKSNTWTQIYAPLSTGAAGTAAWVCFNPTVGSGHTFSLGSGTFATLIVDARSGVGSATPTADDGEWSGTLSTINFSITPPDNGSILYLVGASVDSMGYSGGGFSGTFDNYAGGISGVTYGGGLASLIQTSAATSSPSITATGSPSTFVSGQLFSFKPSGGGGSSATGSATGVASAAGTGASLATSTGSATGLASASGTGRSTAASTASATGLATAAGVGASVAATTGSATGLATATGSGSSVAAGNAIGTAVGVASAAGVGRSTAASTGSALGLATAAGISPNYAAGTGTALAVAVALGLAPQIVSATGTALGISSALGVGRSSGGNPWTPATPAGGTWTPTTPASTIWTPQ